MKENGEAKPAIPKTIVAIGEALWDVFPDGQRPGGAPCNVAFHAARLGDRGVIITRVGDDAAGDRLVAFLQERGVDTTYVQRDPAKPTGTVSVKIEDSEPQFTIAQDTAWDHIVAEYGARALVTAADAICVGSLAQRNEASRQAIQELLSEARRSKPLVVFDVNLRPPFIGITTIEATLRVADVVKMNEAEVAQLSGLFDVPSFTRWLIDSLGVHAVCVTRGENGASMTTQEGTFASSGVVIDTSTGDPVGAGDAFTAAMAHHLVRNAMPDQTLEAANRYAALVATKKGAMPMLSPKEIASIDP